jgi:prepilin-type N-terminal cleavage/methylation domain-containing protein
MSEATKGFTLIELLVVIGLILFFSALIFPNFNFGEKNLALERSSAKLVQDLRRAQEMAMSAKKFTGAPGTFKGAYGIYFVKDSLNYILFADLDDDQVLDSGEAIETLVLEKKVKISDLLPSSPLVITFTPPNPTTKINPSSGPPDMIILTNDIRTKNIRVNKAGLVYTE